MGDIARSGDLEVKIVNPDQDIADISKTTANPNGLNTLPAGVTADGFYPVNIKTETEQTPQDINVLKVDTAGNLMSRSSVLTDENSVYEPFKGSSLSTDWTSLTETGTSISVANSRCTISSGTTSGSNAYIVREIDYSPLSYTFALSITQRIANQDIYVGFSDSATPNTGTMRARFHFYGDDNTKVSCETRSSLDTNGTQGDNTQILLPFGYTTATCMLYKIDFDATRIRYYVGTSQNDFVLLAEHNVQIPDPYTVLNCFARVYNSGTPSSSTDLCMDMIYVHNKNIVDIQGEVTGNVTISQSVLASGSNNSTTPLNASAVFTGVGESTFNVAGIQVNVYADVGSANNGLEVQQSMDNTNWDIIDKFTIQAGVGFSTTVQATGSYFRVKYTNSATNQTVFRLQAILCPIVDAVPRAIDPNGGFLVREVSNKTFVATAGDITIGNNKSMIALLNASGSNVVVRVREIYLKNTQTAAVTGVVARMALRKITGFTSGTSITPIARDSNKTLSASVTCASGATVSGESSGFLDRWSLSTDDWGSGTLDVEALQSIMCNLNPVYSAKGDNTEEVTLRAGEGITVKCETNSTNGQFDIIVVFTEEV